MARPGGGKTVAFLIADGFEESEYFEPKTALEQAGMTVETVSLKAGDVQGLRHMDKDRSAYAAKAAKDARADDYDALVIPGGVFSPDHLRGDDDVLDFVRGFFAAKKPVGAICHGPQVLISARVCDGRAMTAFATVQGDLELAGATVKDQEVVTDRGLVTSRKPDDIPAFSRKLIEEIGEGAHDGRA